MKTVLIAALFVAAALARPERSSGEQWGDRQWRDRQWGDRQWENRLWPWQVGKVYKYEVNSHTLARHHEGPSVGSVMKANFVVRAKAQGRLQAKLEQFQYAQIHEELKQNHEIPENLQYKPVKVMEVPFEISLEGGRVTAMNVPETLTTQQVNILKGLLSALQVDLSSYKVTRASHVFDEESFQGWFNKKEKDVTGDCDTLYTVGPASSEWRRGIPKFADHQHPVEIWKTKNYNKCHRRTEFTFGVPNELEWAGTTYDYEKNQLLKRSAETHIIVGKQGPIYTAVSQSNAFVKLLMYGNQRAEVVSKVTLILVSMEEDKQEEWTMPPSMRTIENLLYSLSSKQTPSGIDFSTENSEEQKMYDISKRYPRSLKNENGNLNIENNLPLNEYMNPKSNEENKNHPMVVLKLTQEISQLIQNFNNMPKNDVLSKYSILVRFIRAMSYEQLQQTSRNIEVAKSSTNMVKSDMWMVYRDAVAEAGTWPAFRQIKNWIETKKLQREEAAEVIATVSTSLRYPIKDLMLEFFELAMSNEVKQQQYLNTTALTSATRYINMGFVNRETKHNYYPLYIYGHMINRHDRFVVEAILPRLKAELESAVRNEEMAKVQVFIRAIGNVGHRAILDIFAPYIDGRIPTSTYQRRLIIESLDVLASQNDQYVRDVLYKVLRNPAENYEVRLATIDNLLESHPSPAMMQAMARMTHDDPSLHVCAALQRAIQQAAKLEDRRYASVYTGAKSAKELLSDKDYSAYYSPSNNFMDYVTGVNNVNGNARKFNIRTRMHGLDRAEMVSALFNDQDQLRKYVTSYLEQVFELHGQKDKLAPLDIQYTAEKIAELLNIKRDREQNIQASINMRVLNQHRFFAIDENVMQLIPMVAETLVKTLKEGASTHYGKMLHQENFVIIFPAAMGVPVNYRYKEPTFVHLQHKLNPNQQKEVLVDSEMQFTFARNVEGSFGFVDLLTNQYSSVGVVNKYQVNIPIKTTISMVGRSLKITLEPLRADQDNTLAHYSVWPYTTYQDKDGHVPVSMDPNTKVLSRNNKITSHDLRFGQVTGTQFQLQGYSYSNDYSNFGKYFENRDMAAMTFQNDVALTHYNIRYLGKQSPTKKIVLSISMGDKYNQQTPAGELKPMKLNEDNHITTRLEELLKRASSGIKQAQVSALDIEAVFEGTQKKHYALTMAVGSSEVDQKLQYAFHAHQKDEKERQINGVATFEEPIYDPTNFVESLKQDLKSKYNVEIIFGQSEKGKILLDGTVMRSPQYKEALQKLPLAKNCLAQMEKENIYQPACYSMSRLARTPDSFKASISYQDISPMVRNMTFQLYRLARHFNFWEVEENPLKTTAEGKLEINMEINYLERRFNAFMNSRIGDVRVYRVPISSMVPLSLFSFYPKIKITEQQSEAHYGHQLYSYCAVDGSRVKTFSNRFFDYTLSKSWHVVMHDQARHYINKEQSKQQLVILARNRNEKEKEVYISYRSNNGEDVIIEMKPEQQKPKIQVQSNTKKVAEAPLTIYSSKQNQMPFMQYHTRQNGEIVLEITERFLKVIYDGQHLMIFADEHRNNTRGICGYMNGEPAFDYLTPNGIVDSPKHFAASWTLKTDASPETLKLQEEANKLAYERRQVNTKIQGSISNWNEDSDSGSESYDNVYRVRYYKRQTTCMLGQQVQFYEHNDKLCITTTELPSCSSKCSSTGNTVRTAEVVCRPRNDEDFRQYREQIRQGESPKVTGVTQISHFRVPAQCQA